jgi:hypothetical protein
MIKLLTKNKVQYIYKISFLIFLKKFYKKKKRAIDFEKSQK